MAFQIIDDILDYTSDDETLGKQAGKDLKEGIYTLPLILAMKKNSRELNDILEKQCYTDEDVKSIIKIVQKYNGIDEAINIAEKYTDKAFKLINKLPENQYKEILLEVTSNLLNRKY